MPALRHLLSAGGSETLPPAREAGVGVRGSALLPEQTAGHPNAFFVADDRQAIALHATHRWLARSEAQYRKSLYRRVYELRQTVWATAQWDTINETRNRNSPEKTEEE